MIVRILYVVNAVARFNSMSTLDSPNVTTKASKAMQIRLNVSGSIQRMRKLPRGIPKRTLGTIYGMISMLL
jgi:hypothetical protein